MFDPIRQLFCSCYTNWDTGFVLTGRGSFPVEICCLYVAVKLGPASQWERQSRGLCSWQEPSTVTWDNRGRGEGEHSFDSHRGLCPYFPHVVQFPFFIRYLVKKWKGARKRRAFVAWGKFGPAHALAGCPDYRRERGCAGGIFLSWECFLILLAPGPAVCITSIKQQLKVNSVLNELWKCPKFNCQVVL